MGRDLNVEGVFGWGWILKSHQQSNVKYNLFLMWALCRNQISKFTFFPTKKDDFLY